MGFDSVGGYRLVRKLGGGTRADVYLGYPDTTGALDGPAALKIYRLDTHHQEALLEAEVLDRAAGDHVMALVDLASDSRGCPVLILERLSAGSLTRVLSERTNLRAGEAITILAPLAMALDRMHTAGAIHGALRSNAVLFDGAGTPTLAAAGHGSLIEPNLPPARRDEHPGIRSDHTQFAALARSVLLRVDDGPSATLVQWLDTQLTRPTSDWLEALQARLFALGQPEPVGFDQPDSQYSGSSVRLREVPVAINEHANSGALVASLGEGFWPETIGFGRTLLARAVASLSQVRARLWFVAGSVLVGLIGAVVIQTGDANTEPAVVKNTDSTSTPLAAHSPVLEDDPIAALEALIEARERCIDELSILCLDAVDQVGSAALSTDQQLIRAVQSGGEVPQATSIQIGVPTLDERIGDTALISLGEVGEGNPVSILMIKGEAGWRIRDLVY